MSLDKLFGIYTVAFLAVTILIPQAQDLIARGHIDRSIRCRRDVHGHDRAFEEDLCLLKAIPFREIQ